MRKEDNDWGLVDEGESLFSVHINGTNYLVESEAAALCHAILLLVDAINDKG